MGTELYTSTKLSSNTVCVVFFTHFSPYTCSILYPDILADTIKTIS